MILPSMPKCTAFKNLILGISNDAEFPINQGFCDIGNINFFHITGVGTDSDGKTTPQVFDENTTRSI